MMACSSRLQQYQNLSRDGQKYFWLYQMLFLLLARLLACSVSKIKNQIFYRIESLESGSQIIPRISIGSQIVPQTKIFNCWKTVSTKNTKIGNTKILKTYYRNRYYISGFRYRSPSTHVSKLKNGSAMIKSSGPGSRFFIHRREWHSISHRCNLQFLLLLHYC